MKYTLTLLAAILLAVAVTCSLPSRTVPVANTEPAFDRVMQTRQLRCAYFLWSPYLSKDPNTGQLSGLTYDVMQQVGRVLNLQIVWQEEVGLSQLADNLASHRTDAVCNTLWPAGNRAPYFSFTQAIDFVPAYAFVRADDTRFDNNPAALNTPATTVAVIDGDFTKAIADEDYPQAHQLALSEDSDGAQLLLAVTTRKADVVFIDPFVVAEFLKTNPGTLKRVANLPPVRVFGDAFATAKTEAKLRDTLNTALQQLTQSGFIAAELDKYFDAQKGDYFYPARAYSAQP